VKVDPAAQQYSVDWHTGDSDLIDGTRYRIVVSVGSKLLGYADVQPYANLGKYRRIADGEYQPLVNGSSLPVKFWIPFSAAQAPIGVNMPDLLWAYLGIAPTTADGARKIMDDARAAGITHVRFVASGYWPINLTGPTGWVSNPDAFFAAFDALVADAGARGLRLVPSLLWNPYMFPDFLGEKVGQLFVPGTATRAMAEGYIRSIVSRYQGNDTILFWEIGNELNLQADIDVSCNLNPDGSCGDRPDQCLYTAPPLGTPACRNFADNFFSCNSCRGVTSPEQDLGQFSEAIAELIHALDPGRPVSSGDQYPRAAAYHMSRCPDCFVIPTDSEDEYRIALANLHPHAVDVVSVHHYLANDINRFDPSGDAGENLLAITKDAATSMGKILYVGEFGEVSDASFTCFDQTTVCGGSSQKIFTERVLDALVQYDVPYAAVWAWEFFQVCPMTPTCFDVEPGDQTTQWIGTHNRAYDSCTKLPDGALCPIGHCLMEVCRDL
jgi:hypothetical protein